MVNVETIVFEVLDKLDIANPELAHHLENDLSMDSQEVVSMIVHLEKIFGNNQELNLISKNMTVAQVIEHVQKIFQTEEFNEKKYALITGATGGIGKEIAHKLLLQGYSLILLSRSYARLQELQSSCRREYADCIIDIHACDVSNAHEVETLCAYIDKNYRGIQVLVNCAGISGGGKTIDIKLNTWMDVINTNLNGTFFIIHGLLSHNLINKGGRIINIASTGGKQGVIYGVPYCASKHGVVGLTKALGLELARNGSGITVNAVCPGFVETDMAQKVREHYAQIWNTDTVEAKKRVEERVPIGRYIEPAEVAAMVSYLASDLASAITAQAINVCGGLGNY